MPSKSEKQARTMRAAAHDPKFAERMHIPQSVAKEFVDADKKKKEDDKKKDEDKKKADAQRKAKHAKAKPTVSKEDTTARSTLGYRYGKEV